jgi:hypothetical protein
MTCGRIPSLIASAASIPSISTCPHRALDAIADLDDVVRIDDLDCREPGIGVDDRIPPARSDSSSSLRLPRRRGCHFRRSRYRRHSRPRTYRIGQAPSRARRGLARDRNSRPRRCSTARSQSRIWRGNVAIRESTEMAPYQWLCGRVSTRTCCAAPACHRPRWPELADSRMRHFSRAFARHNGTHPPHTPAPVAAPSALPGSRAQAPQARTIPRSFRSGS